MDAEVFQRLRSVLIEDGHSLQFLPEERIDIVEWMDTAYGSQHTIETSLSEAAEGGTTDTAPTDRGSDGQRSQEATSRNAARKEKDGGEVACSSRLGDLWLPIGSAPKDATWFIALLPDGEVVRAHWASDLSGSDQPGFQGFFRSMGIDRYSKRPLGFTELDQRPTHWMPLPAPPLAVADKEKP